VFCRYGIVALNTLSSPDDFSLENVYYSDSEIIDGSITIAGNKMVFATRCGVYSFNGSVVTHISRKINGFFADSRVICREEASIYFKGKYYLSYHLTDGSKGMLIYDFADNAWNIYAGPEIQSMALLRDKSTEKMITAFTDSTVAMEWGIGNYFATSGIIEAKWRSPKTFFGEPACKKTVKEIHLSGSGTGKIKITVYGDTASQAREITLTSSLQTFRLPFDISGNQIYFEIENILGAYFKISPLTFVYSLERQFAK